jgi:glucose-6-phosphate isomerase
MKSDDAWRRFCDLWFASRDPDFTLDISRVDLPRGYIDQMSSPMTRAVQAMRDLEAGAIANVDEQRMVGHYWLRAAHTAPTPEIRTMINGSIDAVRAFAANVHDGTIHGAGGKFEHLIHVGIGGSTLGPQLVCEALAGPSDRLLVHFLDNADPDSIDRLVARLGRKLDRTLVSIVSKSGWTPTPWHVMLELEAAYERAGLDFARHAIATTLPGTKLDERAKSDGWLARFPVWEWVGGRTSVTSAVGLVPAALQGLSIDALLAGAASMDRLTRAYAVRSNPGALLALAWHWQGNGRGDRNMVVLPYRDRLALFPRYVQQLVMESIGKQSSRRGEIVRQGLTVFGHKGSSDQHSYFQQLRDGPADFFVTFVRVHEERAAAGIEVENGVTLADYLFGYLEGTRDALYQRGRGSITLSIPRVDATSLGALIALYERAVGLYAELIDVNAYHQPSVDKDAATAVVELQKVVTAQLLRAGAPCTAEEIAIAIGEPERVETVYKILDHLARVPGPSVEIAEDPADRGLPTARFAMASGPPTFDGHEVVSAE